MNYQQINNEVATFVCDNAEKLILELIKSNDVVSDEALNKIHTKIVKEKTLRRGRAADATPEQREKAVCLQIEDIWSDENLEKLMKEREEK
tara:strand:+ start:11262 stop:11534 length:273 start_codon:yes stop_codon:yes gene_type:complete